MIKKIALSVVTVIVLTTVNAQDAVFGVKSGINIANSCNSNTNSRISFHLGATVEFSISDKLSLQPELVYSAQGAKNSDITINTDFINVPVMVKYYVIDNLSIEVGPQIGFLIKSEAKSENSTLIRNSKNLFKSVDYGFNIGAGYKLVSGLNFALRYNMGFSNIYDLENSDAEWKNRVFQVSVGYTF
jgi:hypothetical protein